MNVYVVYVLYQDKNKLFAFVFVFGDNCLSPFFNISKGSHKKVLFFSGPAIRGGGVRTWPLRKKTFFEALKKLPQKK